MNYRNHHSHHRGQQPHRGGGAVHPQKPVPPERVYTDADIHVDVVDMSFSDIRGVVAGTYPDGKPKIEYINEKEATEKGLLDAWQKATPIDEYKQRSND